MNFYTSDWHLGDDRIGLEGKPNLFFRPPYESVEEMDEEIIENMISTIPIDSEKIYHLGDVAYWLGDSQRELLIKFRDHFRASQRILVIGNYDTDEKINWFRREGIFTTYHHFMAMDNTYLNHYPERCLEFSAPQAITGHIHGLWKVHKVGGVAMVNVGVDAWHMRPVSQDQIDFTFNGIANHYDRNVFPHL